MLKASIFTSAGTLLSSDSIQQKLHTALLLNYDDDNIRPVERPTDTVNVTIECVLYQISKVVRKLWIKILKSDYWPNLDNFFRMKFGTQSN